MAGVEFDGVDLLGLLLRVTVSFRMLAADDVELIPRMRRRKALRAPRRCPDDDRRDR